MSQENTIRNIALFNDHKSGATKRFITDKYKITWDTATRIIERYEMRELVEKYKANEK